MAPSVRPVRHSDSFSLKILYPASHPTCILALNSSESLHAFSPDNPKPQLTMLAATSKHYIFNRNSQSSPRGLDKLSMCNAVAVHLLLPEES